MNIKYKQIYFVESILLPIFSYNFDRFGWLGWHKIRGVRS